LTVACGTEDGERLPGVPERLVVVLLVEQGAVFEVGASLSDGVVELVLPIDALPVQAGGFPR
jgi:hypothetical protein